MILPGIAGGIILPRARSYITAFGGYIPDTQLDNAAGTYDRLETRVWLKNGRQAVSRMKLTFANRWAPQGLPEAANNNAITVEATLEASSPSLAVQCRFNGATSYVLQPGEIVETDWIYAADFGLANFPAAKIFFARTGVTGFGTGKVPQNTQVYTAVSGENQKASLGQSSQINGTGALAGATNLKGFGPLCVIGEWVGTPDISFLILGDSIPTGPSTSKFNGTTGGGFMTHGLASVGGGIIPNTKASRSGGKASEFHTGNSNPAREYLMSKATHMSENFGVNDMRAAVAGSTVLADKRALWAKFRQLSPYGYIVSSPISPNCKAPTDSPANPDAYTTYVNQVAYNSLFAQGGDRDVLNAAVAGYVGTEINEVIDTNSVWEVANADWAGRGIWRIGTNITGTGASAVGDTASFATSDGTHPAIARHADAAALVTAAAANWVLT